MILEVVEPHAHAACAAEAFVELNEDLIVDLDHGIEAPDELDDHLELVVLELLDVVCRYGFLEYPRHDEI